MKQVAAGLALASLLLFSSPTQGYAGSVSTADALKHSSIVQGQKTAAWSESAKPPKEDWSIKLFSAAMKVQDFLTKRNLILSSYDDTTQLLIKIR